jgi:hypothetical protein
MISIKAPKLKRIKVLKEHCPVCKELLKGNNSSITPWECSCGIWRYNIVTFEYDIIKEEDQ